MRAVTRSACALLGALAAACGGSPPAQSCFTRTDYQVGNGPSAVAIGDFNRDGKLDLAVTNNTDATVSVLLGNGDGTFRARVDYATGKFPYAIAVADLNGDTFLDLAVGDGGGGVSVLLGDGKGSFAAKVDSPAAPAVCPNADGIAVGDFNGDGSPDLIVANDLASGGIATVSLMLGNKSASFGAPATFSTGNSTESVAVGDFNHDGKLDVAAANLGSSTVTVLLGNGAGGFSAKDYIAGGGPYFVATGDLDKDGWLDLVTANSFGSTVSVLLGNGPGIGNGPGTFRTEVRYATGAAANSVAIADVDGDGKLDLATANYGDGTVSVLLGNGDGTFQAKTDYTVGTNPFSVAAADLDGNGKADLAVANWTSGTVSVLLRSCP